MTYTYVNGSGPYGGNILLEPDRPVTQIELYNTLAELNSRVRASLDVPDWFCQLVVALLVAAAVAAACIAVVAVCNVVIASRSRAGSERPDGWWEEELGTCRDLVAPTERGFRCSACGAYSETGDVLVEGQSYTVETTEGDIVEYDDRQLFAFCPNCGREVVDDDCE